MRKPIMYMFQLSIMSAYNGHYLHARIVKGDKTLVDTYEQDARHMASVTTFTTCAAGEKVWVKVSTKVNQVWGSSWPAFTGAYLSA